jgi:hypothetical protein
MSTTGKGKGSDPSDRVLGQNQRSVNGGVVSIPVNSHCATGNFYVDRSRVSQVDKTDWTEGNYREYQEPASIMDNARQSMGEMSACSSFQDRTHKARRARDERKERLMNRGDE